MSKLSERRKQILEMSEPEARRELNDLREKLVRFRFQQQRGEVKNSRAFAQTRKDIARVLHRLSTGENEE